MRSSVGVVFCPPSTTAGEPEGDHAADIAAKIASSTVAFMALTYNKLLSQATGTLRPASTHL
jgi:hypothetical protein